MTHFEHQKASKIALENWVIKQYASKNRGGFGGGCVADKIATWRQYNSLGTITRRARRASPFIKETLPPPSVQARFAPTLGHFERSLGRKYGFGVFLKGFWVAFRVRDTYLGNLSL